MKKKTLSLLLCLAFLLALLPATARADGDCGDALAWTFDDATGKLTITGSGDMWDWSWSNTPWEAHLSHITSVELPAGLTTIGGRAFCGTKITGIEIPGTVTAIAGSYAFSGCTGLTHIAFPSSLTSIGDHAFSGCTGLTSLTIPGNVTEVKGDAFSGCSGITQLTLKKGIEKLENYAFKNCTGLTTLTIPDGVKTIGLGAFMGCANLTSVTMPCDTWLYNAPTYPVFEDCPAISTVRLTPGDPDNQGVMRQTNMYDIWRTTEVDVSVTLDEGIQAINHRSFRDAVRLKSIKLPNSLLVIGDGAFMGCTGLAAIDVPNSVEIIGEGAFSGCTGLTSFVWPEPANTSKMTTIAQQMFMDCTNLASITLPARVRQIDNSAFSGCTNLKDVYYGGTKAQKENMLIRDSNSPLNNATWHFKETPVAPPAITAHPKDVSVTNGANATFTVKATGEGIAYQWYSRPNANVDWTLVDGATKDSYTVTGTADKNGWQFRCRVKNGGGEVYSNLATLTVTKAAPPTIKTQPKSANVKSGSKAKFTVKVKEKGVTYQWSSKAPGAADWTELPGETKATLTVVASKANSGTQYRCRVRTAAGGEDSTIAVTLTVTPQAPAIKTQPKSLTVVSGKKAKFTVKASGPKLTYTWYSRPNAEAAWTPVAGQTKNSLTIVASKANDGSQYYCKVQNTDGEVDSAVVTLTVTPQPPTIKTQPKDAKVKIGAKAKFKVKATGKNVTYQWYYRTSETGDWVPMEGETSATLTVTATAEKIGWQFRCQARNADGFANSNPATLRQK